MCWGTTVKFIEYAFALLGMLHGAGLCWMGKERGVPPLNDGPPSGPMAPRVLTTRQGVKGKKASAVLSLAESK